MTGRLSLVAALLVLTAVTFYFPGRTYLQSDTQIYVPMMERDLAGPGVLASDPMATRAHTSFTLYDDIAILLRKITGAGFERILLLEQIAFRALGVWGLWLIATGLGYSQRKAWLLVALTSLGAAIAGPAVLTVEYEPVPRGFAMGALLLALGLALHRRFAWAGFAAALATVLHAPTAWPIWPALLLAPFGPCWHPLSQAGLDPIREMARTAGHPRKPLLILCCCLAGAFGLLLLTAGASAPPSLFGSIPPWLEQIQRMRASYSWVSEWKWQYFAHYALMSGILILAALRIRVPRWLLVPALFGIVSIPLSWLLLEQMKWSLMPQFQPARAVLWITLFGLIFSIGAALNADRWWQRALWLLPGFWIPIGATLVPEVFGPRDWVMALLLAAVLGYTLTQRRPIVSAAIALASFWLIPNWTNVHNYRTDLHTPELAQVAEWARANTAPDSVFLFADAKRGLEPGIFRARSLRSLYVDWKSGGQANYFPDYAREWKARWEAAGQCEGDKSAASLAALGIDYAVFRDTSTGGELVFRNGRFAVYRVKRDR